MSRSVFVSVILSLCYASTALAALALGPAEVHSNHPNHCFVETSKKLYKPGETWNLEGCMQAECVLVSNSTGVPHLMISYASCGVVAVDPPCYLTENKAAAYPDCCPEPVCPDSAEEEPMDSMEPKESKSQEEQQEVKMTTKKVEDSSANQVSQNIPHPLLLSDFFRASYPSWDDDYLYGDHDHMDNNIDDLQYLDYYPSVKSSSSGRFTHHDFNIANYRWF